MNQKGSWSFAPVYDITFSYGPGGEHSMLYIVEGKNPTFIHLEKLAKKHAIKEYKIIIDEVQSVVSNWKIMLKI